MLGSSGRYPPSVVALTATLGLLAAASSARAAEPEPLPKIAVLDVKAVGSVDPASVAALLSLIASEAARSKVTVVSGADLQALVGLETQKQLVGCSDGSCLAQLGGALGVELLLTSEVGEVGGRWLLTTTLLDVARATALARVTKVGKTAGDLVDVAAAAVAETMAVLTPTAAPTAVDASAAPATVVTPAPPPRHGDRLRVAAYVLGGVSGVALLGGVIAGVIARKEHADALETPPASAAALVSKKESIDRKLWTADGLFIGAAVTAGVGATLYWLAPSAAAETAAVSVTAAPTPGGGVLLVTGEL